MNQRFAFAVTEDYRQPSRLITLKLFRTVNNHALLVLVWGAHDGGVCHLASPVSSVTYLE